MGLALRVALAALVCTSSAHATPVHDADKVRLELADAFQRKDTNAIRERVLDGWSGLRFTESWDAEMWQTCATALRTATLSSSAASERVYKMTLRHANGSSQTKEAKFLLSEHRWRLDYNSFLGPFPHL